MNDAGSSTSTPSGVQGVCPTGFHLPSIDEWTVLKDYVHDHYGVGGGLIGRKLKESGTNHWETDNGNNETGFTALGAGHMYVLGGTPSFKELKVATAFWSATQYSGNTDQAMYFKFYDSGVVTTNSAFHKTGGYPVRCIKDEKEIVMKRLIFLLISVLLIYGASAQPIITQLMNLEIGDKYTVKRGGNSIALPMITEGTNQMWDFSNLPDDNNSGMAICVDKNTTPFKDSTEVKNSNIAIKPFGAAADDTVQIYQYLRIANENSETMATGFHHRINNSNLIYTKWLDPAKTIMPFTYGDSYNDRSILWIFDALRNTYILKDTSNMQVAGVGYGTLKTPAGTFKNALLVKTTVDWIWWNNYGEHIYKTEGTDINYQWLVQGIKIAVLTVNLAGTEASDVVYISDTQFNKGGIDNPDDNGGNGGGNGNGEVYNPDGIWLNTFSSSGGFFEKSNGSLSFTMGESVTKTFVVNPTLTQGFNQPNEILVNSAIIEDIKIKVKVYPNPFVSYLTIDYSGYKQPIDAVIYSSIGQIVKMFLIDGPINRVQMNGCKPGVYYIKIMDKEMPRTFVVVKK